MSIPEKKALVRRLSTNTCLEFIISIVFLEFIGYTVYSVFTIQQYSLLVQQYPLFSYTCTVYLPVQYIVFSYTVQYIQLYSTVQLSVQYSIFTCTVHCIQLYSTVYLAIQYSIIVCTVFSIWLIVIYNIFLKHLCVLTAQSKLCLFEVKMSQFPDGCKPI